MTTSPSGFLRQLPPPPSSSKSATEALTPLARAFDDKYAFFASTISNMSFHPSFKSRRSDVVHDFSLATLGHNAICSSSDLTRSTSRLFPSATGKNAIAPAILTSTVQVDASNSYKRFQCSVCGHSSVQKKDLVKHMRIHTGEKPFKCRYCEYRSTQSSNVNTHVKRVHPETLPDGELDVPTTSHVQ